MTGQEADNKENFYLKPHTLLHHGQYRTEKVLGHGGFGITYLAHDLNLNQKVALKEYFPQGFCGRETTTGSIQMYGGKKREFYKYGLERYIEEARTLANFNYHSGIVDVYNYFQENNTAYMIMQYLEGQTVRQWLKDKGERVSWAEALAIMGPVMETLKVMHQTGLIHRDISPDNIYICDSGQVKVLDLGAARIALGEQSNSLSVILKQGYTPFEQYTTKGRQGAWTDLYAVCATIYRMISGQVPPISTDRVVEDELPERILHGNFVPREFKAIMLKALAPAVNQRYQNIESFQLELAQAATLEAAGTVGMPAEAAAALHALGSSTGASPLLAGSSTLADMASLSNGGPLSSGSDPASGAGPLSGGLPDPLPRHRWLPPGLPGLQGHLPAYKKWPLKPIDTTMNVAGYIQERMEEESSVFRTRPWLAVTLIVCLLLIALLALAGAGWFLYSRGLISF